jgi:hypothetical protein
MSNHVMVDVLNWAWMKSDQHLQKHVQMLLGMLFDLIFTVDVAIDVFASGLPLPL